MQKPFTDNPSESVGAWGEIFLLEKISKWMGAFPRVARASPRGSGDDCAVLPCVSERENFPVFSHRIVTTDSLILGKHFDESVSARDAGAKLIRRNASDIAAMGGVPADAVLALVMSPEISQTWLKDFYLGMCETCDALGIELAGGDVASAPAKIFSATLALTGFAERPLLRTGARAGDLIFVSGTLGGSIAKKHFAFTPRIAEGRFLAAFPPGAITACIDVTDGLKKDHAALLPPGTHAEFDFSALPISDDARALGGDLIERVFCDGEDYELLFCVAPEFELELRERWAREFPKTPLSRIGKISPGARELDFLRGNAYEHFRR